MFRHTCNTADSRDELKKSGISASVAPFPASGLACLVGLTVPPEPVVGIYAPTAHYHDEVIPQLAVQFPDIGFFVTGVTEQESFEVGNIRVIGKGVYDKRRYYGAVSVVIRMTKHDSLPRTLIEAMVARRHIITNVRMPAGEDGVELERTEPDFRSISKVLDKLISGGGWKELADEKRQKFWLGQSDYGKYRETVHEMFQDDIVIVP